MDWGRFGVRVAQRDIPRLGDMLDSMEDAKVKELQVGHGTCCDHVWLLCYCISVYVYS